MRIEFVIVFIMSTKLCDLQGLYIVSLIITRVHSSQAKTQKVQQEKAASKILAGTQNIKGLEEKLQVWSNSRN